VIDQIDTKIIMKVTQSGRQPHASELFFGVRVRQPFYFGRTRTTGHLTLGV